MRKSLDRMMDRKEDVSSVSQQGDLAGPNAALGRMPLLEAMRPMQWIKNLLVFAAPMFAFSLNLDSLLKASAAFAVFCAVSSASYLINDLFDRDQDRRHPVKRNRPLASGRLSAATAWAASLILAGAGIGLSAVLGLQTSLVVAAYLMMQAAYNLALKHILIVDVMTLASGFVLRAVAGGVATQVRISPWFLFCVALVAFYIGLQKRKGELKRAESGQGATRKILKEYSISYLREIETAVLACILMGYTLWTIQAAETGWMMLSAPFVLYGILRYQYLSQHEIVERPEEVLLRDRPSLVNLIFWVLTCLGILAADHWAGL